MKLSLLLPAYNEEEMMEKTYHVMKELLEKEQISFEIVIIDDGSKDNTWNIIEQICKEDSLVHGIRFSRNFGKESAIFAGLANAKGDCCVIMDADLQHPPETVVEMYRLWEQGYEVVEGVKTSRGKESKVHKFAAGLFYKVMTNAVKIDMSRASDFKLMDRKAIDALLSMPEKNAFFRALSSWVGFKTTSVEFEVREREAGESKWSFRSLTKYAITNIASFSAAPMQFVSIVGLGVFIFAIILSIQTLVKYFTGHAVEGFTTVILLVLLLGSIVMISLGIIGFYISKIYEEVKERPKYFISKSIQEDEHYES